VNQESQNASGSSDDERLSGIVTPTASDRFDPRWLARLSWNRVVTATTATRTPFLSAAAIGSDCAAGSYARWAFGITPARSIFFIESTVNSELGALPAITTIRIESLFFGPFVTF